MSAQRKVPGSRCPACCHEASRRVSGATNACPWVDELLEVFCAGFAGPQTRDFLTLLAPCASDQPAADPAGQQPSAPPNSRHLRLI